MKRRSWFVWGVAVLLVSCSNASNRSQAPVNQPTVEIAQNPASKTQSFANPVVSPMATVEVPAVPGLLRPTNVKARLPGIAAGRPDPFAALTTPPMKISTATRNSASLAHPQPVSALPPIPTVPLTPLPAGSVATPGVLPALPPLPAAPVSQTSVADAIDITGAVKIGGQWSVIVKEPDAQTSRYVKAGDYLAGGRVLVKRIVAGASSDPFVILQQNGIEVTKSLGSSSGPIASK